LIPTPKRGRARLAVLVASALTFLASAVAAQAATWEKGDIFVGVSNGTYQVRTNAGVFKENISTSSGFTTGCAFDTNSDFYGTWFSANNVFKFDDVHPHTSSAFGSGYSTPESIVFAADGHVLVGNLGNGIREYDASGAFVKTVINTRVDFLDLAADQDTILYTQEGNSILRVSRSTGASLSNFTTGTATQAFALRILPDGTVLLADQVNVKRYNAAGVVIQTYDVAGEDSWFSLNLDPNGTSFWAGNFNSANVYKFNIASGAVETSFNTGTGSQTLFGLCLLGEITVAVDVTAPICPITATGTDAMGRKFIEITVRDDGSGLSSITSEVVTNAVLTIPPFTVGTNDPVVVRATKVNQSQSSTIRIRVMDVAGNIQICDPVVDLNVRESGEPAAKTYTDLPAVESKITITNGDPGLRRLDVTVNGKTWKVTGLADNEVRTLDVASAMVAGDNNTITVKGYGRPGAQALIVIADT
jgi:hypothetical protein